MKKLKFGKNNEVENSIFKFLGQLSEFEENMSTKVSLVPNSPKMQYLFKFNLKFIYKALKLNYEHMKSILEKGF